MLVSCFIQHVLVAPPLTWGWNIWCGYSRGMSDDSFLNYNNRRHQDCFAAGCWMIVDIIPKFMVLLGSQRLRGEYQNRMSAYAKNCWFNLVLWSIIHGMMQSSFLCAAPSCERWTLCLHWMMQTSSAHAGFIRTVVDAWLLLKHSICCGPVLSFVGLFLFSQKIQRCYCVLVLRVEYQDAVYQKEQGVLANSFKQLSGGI